MKFKLFLSAVLITLFACRDKTGTTSTNILICDEEVKNHKPNIVTRGTCHPTLVQ